MKHTIIALAAAGLVAAAVPSAANAGCRGCAVGAGVIGGLAAGAIIGGAIANSQAAPVYVAPPPPPRYVEEYDDGPVCHTERRRVWVDGYGWRSHRVQVCD